MADGERIMNGEEPKTGSVNEVKDVPENFKQWVEKNRDRIEKANNRGTLPYFIKDNYKEGNINNKFIWEAEKRVKTEAEKADIQKRWDERKAGKLDEVIQMLNDERIKYNEVMMHQRLLPESEIISRVGGGDLTKGSCSSLAFTYAGNKCGFDVLDFRDGSSRAKFSSAATINNIADKVGGIVVKNTSDFAKATDLLKHVKEGKEYYFTCGKHAAIVRKTATGYEYLELQSSIENGFKELTTMKLKSRFGAKQSHTFHGHKYETRDCIIDIELLQKDASFRKLLGYINTPESEQKKGKKGSIK
jgi:hypothetical protein